MNEHILLSRVTLTFTAEGQTSRQNNFNFFEDTYILNADEKESCEGLLSKLECLQALKSMEPEKTPGSEVIPVEKKKSFGTTSLTTW